MRTCGTGRPAYSASGSSPSSCSRTAKPPANINASFSISTVSFPYRHIHREAGRDRDTVSVAPGNLSGIRLLRQTLAEHRQPDPIAFGAEFPVVRAQFENA